ncbi:MAG: aminopeptidase P family protein [Chloroflexi bacterium]|nr:aminopeptidase P family protein [Chloroflexota bacterium]
MMTSRSFSRPIVRPLTAETLGIPRERERYALRKRIIGRKLNTVLLPAMRRHGIDMWLVLGREFHPDPFLAELGGGWPGVRNAYIFFDGGGDVPEKIFIGSHGHREDLFDQIYDQVTCYGYSQEGLAPHLREAVHKRAPQRIGVNMSSTLPMADGLSAVLKQYLEEALGPEYSSRLVSAELVARDFRATRVPEEVGVYQRLCEWTVAWEEEAFSPRVVWPGATSSDDIHWWMRDKARELDLEIEFHPGIRVTRRGQTVPDNQAILPGDVLTVDAGLAFDLYRTDYKRTAYVLHPEESEPPASLQSAFAAALEVRDKLVANMRPSAIAHQVWDKTMEWAQSLGYEIAYPAASGRREPVKTKQVGIYCHSIGNATHDIGARVAVDWPMAYGDRVRYPLEANQWYSVEFHVSVPVPEWDGLAMTVSIEETIALTDQGARYFVEPMAELMRIPA